MERCVKVGDVLRLGKGFGAKPYNGQCAGIVQGSQIRKVFQMMVCIGVDDVSSGIVTAVYDTMTGEAKESAMRLGALQQSARYRVNTFHSSTS